MDNPIAVEGRRHTVGFDDILADNRRRNGIEHPDQRNRIGDDWKNERLESRPPEEERHGERGEQNRTEVGDIENADKRFGNRQRMKRRTPDQMKNGKT